MGNNMTIKYLKGDATQPVSQDQGTHIVAHVVNNKGAWGAGFTAALVKWPEAQDSYEMWVKNGLSLGKTLGRPVRTTENIIVFHMCAQEGLRSKQNPIPLQYGALEVCLTTLGKVARGMGASVHMPRIGCGLGGASWGRIEPLIEERLKGVDVFVYDLP
jgi:O-acetyl-ADP-ribose deacetylase (regulator of RNase III)